MNYSFPQHRSTTSWHICVGILSLGCINSIFCVFHPLKIIWTSVSLNILLNSLLSPWLYGTETKASLVVSWVEAWFVCGLLFGFFRNQSG